MIKECFEIAELAKNCNMHWVANLIFGFMWEYYYCSNRKILKVEIESYSKNSGGKTDLITLQWQDGYGIFNFYTNYYYICMPIEMLGWQSAYRLVKKFGIVERRNHNRTTHIPDSSELSVILSFLRTNHKNLFKNASKSLSPESMELIKTKLIEYKIIDNLTE